MRHNSVHSRGQEKKTGHPFGNYIQVRTTAAQTNEKAVVMKSKKDSQQVDKSRLSG